VPLKRRFSRVKLAVAARRDAAHQRSKVGGHIFLRSFIDIEVGRLQKPATPKSIASASIELARNNLSGNRCLAAVNGSLVLFVTSSGRQSPEKALRPTVIVDLACECVGLFLQSDWAAASSTCARGLPGKFLKPAPDNDLAARAERSRSTSRQRVWIGRTCRTSRFDRVRAKNVRSLGWTNHAAQCLRMRDWSHDHAPPISIGQSELDAARIGSLPFTRIGGAVAKIWSARDSNAELHDVDLLPGRSDKMFAKPPREQRACSSSSLGMRCQGNSARSARARNCAVACISRQRHRKVCCIVTRARRKVGSCAPPRDVKSGAEGVFLASRSPRRRLLDPLR